MEEMRPSGEVKDTVLIKQQKMFLKFCNGYYVLEAFTKLVTLIVCSSTANI